MLERRSSYRASIIAPPEVKISIMPSVLTFKSTGEKQSFVLKVGGISNKTMLSASLVWNDGDHQVRSPIVVFDPYAGQLGVSEEKLIILKFHVPRA